MIFWNTIKPFNGIALSLVPLLLVFRYLYYVTESQFVVLFLVQKCGGKSPYLYIRYLVFITQKIPDETVYQYRHDFTHRSYYVGKWRNSDASVNIRRPRFLISVEAPKIGMTHLQLQYIVAWLLKHCPFFGNGSINKGAIVRPRPTKTIEEMLEAAFPMRSEAGSFSTGILQPEPR